MVHVLAMALAAALAAEPGRNELEAAAAALADGRAAEALKALDAVAKVNDLSRDAYIDSVELRALALVGLKKDALAEKAFAILAALDPQRTLRAYASGKAKALFLNAVTTQKTPFEFLSGKAVLEPNTRRIVQLTTRVKGDKLNLSKKVRFHLSADRKEWKVTETDVVERYASVSTNAERVDWWAELLGERGAVIAVVGSESSPMIEPPGTAPEPPKPAAVTPAPEVAIATPAPAPPAPAPSAVTEPSSPAPEGVTQASGEKPASVLRPVAYVVGGVGVVAGVVGTIFGVMSANGRAALEAAKTEAAGGPITKFTQAQAYRLDRDARGQAVTADILWGVGGAAVVTAVVLFIVGAPEVPQDTQVGVGPTGLTVYGQF